jgi:hypothetical protein
MQSVARTRQSFISLYFSPKKSHRIAVQNHPTKEMFVRLLQDVCLVESKIAIKTIQDWLMSSQLSLFDK